MCDICVIESVKQRMLTRRDLFRAAPVAVAAAVVGTAPPALAQGAQRVIDMTYKLSPDFPTWGGDPGIAMEQVFSFGESGFNTFHLQIAEHTGTHIDAPLHFSADGASVDEIAVEDLVCPLCVVDIRERAEGDPDTMVTPEDLQGWISANGPIPDGACVAMHSGWQANVTTDAFRGADADGTQHYPGFHEEAAAMLMEETGAVALAVDTLSLDPGNSTTFATHYSWLPSGRYGIENIANLAEVPAAGATLVVGAPTHAGGSGGPARVIALV